MDILEVGVLVLEEVLGAVEFDDLSEFEHHNPVASEHGVDPMGDNEHCGVGKLLVLDLLDLLLCLQVNVGGGLVENNQLSFVNKCPREADDLLFTLAEIVSVCVNLGVQAFRLECLVHETELVKSCS